LTELLPQWLERANAHGYAPPPEHLPALLDAARGRTDLRPAVLAFAGVRGRWLAEQNREWSFVRRTIVAPPAHEAATSAPEDDERLWGEGLFAERVALLARVRESEPERARALLGPTWAKERAEDRLLFLDCLRRGSRRPTSPSSKRRSTTAAAMSVRSRPNSSPLSPARRSPRAWRSGPARASARTGRRRQRRRRAR
ncbi:hypothetical protein GA0115252_104823, partial [Streptomyces sp. DfronAA-171]